MPDASYDFITKEYQFNVFNLRFKQLSSYIMIVFFAYVSNSFGSIFRLLNDGQLVRPLLFEKQKKKKIYKKNTKNNNKQTDKQININKNKKP